ncbi:zinc transporter 9 [Glossina fuscipes]|uniref:Proton-coupled zinc antiporter SLC30A9, mitochondrial n=1 Tax=Glossina fuscipes TaxID=7396 RepID=A0A9C5YXQ2_9MUSC|nr:zinc transporter 9 [Glossina fuscipes]
MLPRSVDLVRSLHLKQCFIGQQALKRFHRLILLSGYGEIVPIKIARTICSHKDKKLAASAFTTTSSSGSTRDSLITTQTKTTENTATEPKAVSETQLASLMSADAPTQTKKLDIETSKGILSITTTIEDSKINEIVFEKTNSLTIDTPIETTAESILKKEADVIPTITKELSKTTNAVIKQVNAAAKAASMTIQMSKATSDELLTKKTSSSKAPSEVKTKPKRIKVDCNRSSLERNFITPARAMSDFLLKAADLEPLPKIKRRSPYEQEPPITVYWRKDVEAKAIEVWGSKEILLRETLKRELERKTHQQNIFTVKRRLRDYRREMGYRTTTIEDEPGLRGKSGKVVLIAIGINGLNFLFKVGGWLYSGSHSMFAEAVHSLADTINQLILAYGIHKSTQMADPDHPYGYSNMKYVSSLISGVGIFCVGTGLSVYHGITGIMNPEPMENFLWALFILGGSLVSEGATLLVAVNEIRRAAKLSGIPFKEYVITGKDPCVNVVLTEDAAAVASVVVAACCMGVSIYTGSPVYDAVGSLLVGSLLGAVASFIIYTNVAALVGRSIPQEHLERINSELESDIMIRAIHDVKGIDMGNSLVRYKAEIDFDGRELTRFYFDKQELSELLKVVKSFQTVDELEQFLLSHGENIVDLMGGEIDRIEMKLRKKFPEIRHCDLEIL